MFARFLKSNWVLVVLAVTYIIRVIHLARAHDPWRYVLFGTESGASLAASFLIFAVLIADFVLKRRASKRGVPMDVDAAVCFAAAILESIAARTDHSQVYFMWFFFALAVALAVGALVKRYSRAAT